MPGYELALLVDQHRHRPPPFEDGCGNFAEVGLAVKPRIARVGFQPLDGPALDLIGRPVTHRRSGLWSC